MARPGCDCHVWDPGGTHADDCPAGSYDQGVVDALANVRHGLTELVIVGERNGVPTRRLVRDALRAVPGALHVDPGFPKCPGCKGHLGQCPTCGSFVIPNLVAGALGLSPMVDGKPVECVGHLCAATGCPNAGP